MDYAKKYPITQQPGEHVLVQWTRGYKQVEVYYNNELVGTADGAGNLKKGVRLVHPTLGNIDLKLQMDPIVLDVIIDGFHSPINRSHPAKQIKQVAAVFWAIFTFGIIGTVINGLTISFNVTFGIVTFSIDLLIVAAYGIAAYYCGKGKPWAYIMGFSVFSFMTLISLLTLLSGNFFVVLAVLIRIGLLIVLIINMKHVAAAMKHLKYGDIDQRKSEDLLDSKL